MDLCKTHNPLHRRAIIQSDCDFPLSLPLAY
jgi:hypothetical protein